MKQWQKVLISVACFLCIAATTVAIIGPEKVLCRTLSLGLGLFGDSNGSAYLYALSIEDDIMESETQTELERVVSRCSSSKMVKPSESGWGHKYVLLDGERMIQYMIKGNAPLEVVYDCKHNVKAVFTSYE